MNELCGETTRLNGMEHTLEGKMVCVGFYLRELYKEKMKYYF